MRFIDTDVLLYAVQDVTSGIMMAALEARRRFQLSYWDAAIIEAARAIGCTHVLSEDLNDGQDYGGIRTANSLAASMGRQNERVEIAEHIDALREQGSALAEAASRAGLDAAVPPCPPWLVKDLLRHTGYIHRWAARHITERPPSVLDGPSEDEILLGGTPDAELIDWFLAGHAALIQALSAADPGLECATFMPAPSPLAFWARRQAHETAIHRADAESATGNVPDYPPEFAADGIDELIMGFGQRRKYRPAATGPTGGLRIQAADTGDAWHVSAASGRVQAHRGPGEPARPGQPAGAMDCTVSGPASSVYLFLWNRSRAGAHGVTVCGDPSFLDAWQATVRVRWN